MNKLATAPTYTSTLFRDAVKGTWTLRAVPDVDNPGHVFYVSPITRSDNVNVATARAEDRLSEWGIADLTELDVREDDR